MRKILSFLALLVVGFALPQWAHAWDFTKAEDPYKIVLHFNDISTGTHDMKFDSTTSTWKTEPFTAGSSGYLHFTVRCYYKQDNQEKYHEYYQNIGAHQIYDSTSSSGWFYPDKEPQHSGTSFYQGGLVNGNRYVVELKANNGDSGKFILRVIKYEEAASAPATLYLYDTTPKRIGTATNNNGTYTFNVDLAGNTYFVLGTKDNLTSWTNGGLDDYKYSVMTDKLIPCVNSKFVKGGSKAWYTSAGDTGNYTITVDWANKTLTAVLNVVDVAWNYNTNTKPVKVELMFQGEITPRAMTFGSADYDYWSYTFKTNAMEKNFTVRSYYENGKYIEYRANVGAATPGTPVYVTGNPRNAGTYFYQRGLMVGKTYRIELCNHGTATDAFEYRFVDLNPTPKVLYLYKIGANNAVTQIGEASVDSENGNFTFSDIELEKGTKVIMSKNKGATSLTGSMINDGRLCPSSEKQIPGKDIDFTNNNTGYWITSTADTFTFTGNWVSQKLTVTTVNTRYPNAPAAIYLLKKGSGDNWGGGNNAIHSGINAQGQYKYRVVLNKDDQVILSTRTSGGYADLYDGDYKIYSPGDPIKEMKNGSTSSWSCNATNHAGAWKAAEGGKNTYIITLQWAESGNLTFSVEIEWDAPAGLHLPLTSADFKDRKKHYFIVGERMGEWHLQPEWELEVKNGKAVLNDRFIYDGKFAVAVVDSFRDYANHNYTLYSNSQVGYGIYNGRTNCTLNASEYYFPKKGEQSNCPGKYLNSTMNNDYWEGRGQYVKEIAVTLNASGIPTALDLSLGTFEESTKQRVFTLVGSNIYNRNYCNSSSDGFHTPMYNENTFKGNGWQEGWIQYDPATNKPYVDARGEYIYLTSFTPDYMNEHPVRFNTLKPDGDEHPYSSANIQFLHWTQLPNLDKDPYKDFYQALKDKTSLTTGETLTDGSTYNFKVKTAHGTVTGITKDWECYVIPDVWIGGEVKFWTGWGGNQDKTNGGTLNIATFHGPNGGPSVGTDSSQPVQGFDITGGGEAVLYHNGRNISNSNYIVSSVQADGTAKNVYFNRIVLWFNNADGVNKSYIQFLQESGGPAISARATENAETAQKNYITYNWYLNPVATNADLELDVIAYEITRHRIVKNAATFMGYPEGEKVDISAKGLKVKDLLEGHSQSFTTFIDTGADPGKGFSPGIYQYDIWVTYKDAQGHTTRKPAWSNRVTIYSNEMVMPDAVALQLVELRNGYTDKYGTEHVSGKKYFGKDADEEPDVQDGAQEKKWYLTYRPNDNANFYLLQMEKKQISVNDGLNDEGNAEGVEFTKEVWLPLNAEIVDSEKAVKFLKEEPCSYWWTSDYYVRCLDYNEYTTTMQRYVDEGVVIGGVPDPVVRLFDIITPEDGSKSYRRLAGIARPFTFGDEKYYSAIVKRGGNLADAAFETYLHFKYTGKDENGQEKPMDNDSYARTQIDPVTPRPFMPLYRYVYDRPARGMYKTDAEGNPTNEKYQWGKISVPTRNWETKNTADALEKDLMKPAYVKFDEQFDPRNLTLQVDFYRPNVNKEIYQFYDIHYDINFTNKDEATNGVFVDLDVVLHDVDTDDANFPNRYRMEFSGVHPRNEVYPIVSFLKTEYEPGAKTLNPETNRKEDKYGQPLKSQTGNYGDLITIDARHSVNVKSHDDGLQNVHLGHIERVDKNGKKTYDWMYKGHEDFKDEPEELTPTNYPYEDQNMKPEEQTITPLYYLIELKNNSGDYAYYNYLVPHDPNHVAERGVNGKPIVTVDKETGLLLNDKDPLIATYIAKGFEYNEYPEVVATAIYLFERPVAAQKAGVVTNFNRLEIVSYNYKDVSGANKNKIRSNEDPKNPRNLPTMGELSVKGYGELPDVDTTPTDNTDDILDMDAYNESGYKSYVAVKGATYTTTLSEDNVTGVEDVLAGYDDGEVVYYNMQGVRVAEPTAAGVYLKVQGRKVTKVVID